MHLCNELNHYVSTMTMRVEVVYATASLQKVVALDVPAGTTARQAAELSLLDTSFPELDLNTNPLGVYGVLVSDEHILQDRDRVELYRGLDVDPMEARRRRASQKRSN